MQYCARKVNCGVQVKGDKEWSRKFIQRLCRPTQPGNSCITPFFIDLYAGGGGLGCVAFLIKIRLRQNFKVCVVELLYSTPRFFFSFMNHTCLIHKEKREGEEYSLVLFAP
jgi:hypothetical protein